MHAFRQVLWAPCMCRCVRYTGVVNISVYICVHARYRVCTCAHVCAVCSFSNGERGWGGPECTCCLAGGVIFDRRRDGGIVCVFVIFNAGGSLCGRRCVYTHTHAHCTYWVLRCEPKGRDETPGGPEESRWTKSRHMCIRKCVQTWITHLHVYASWQDEILE